jgi:hypothetical protein
MRPHWPFRVNPLLLALGAGGYVLLRRTKQTPTPGTPTPGTANPVQPINYRPPVPPPPVNVPTPAGWVHLSKVPHAVQLFAAQVLKDHVKPTAPPPYGYFEPRTIDGTDYAAIIEPHWDNHVSEDFKWHPGVSILGKSQ